MRLIRQCPAAFLASLLSVTASATPALAWGAQGHQITGIIAESHLSETAAAQIHQFMGKEDLAQASTWPDEMRATPSDFWRHKAGHWHYVTVAGDDYQPSDRPREGDAMSALAAYSAVLRDPRRDREEKRVALRFVVHIIGDLHQPLHAGAGGNQNDHGGNDVPVVFLGRSMPLHGVWDYGLIEQRGMSSAAYAAALSANITPAQVSTWRSSSPAQWVHESIALRKTIYPQTRRLSDDYARQHQAEVDERLEQAGVRIAAWLNAIFQAETASS
ncbi:S1/P1 nuclease [Novosphingobium rosa]|uniref:S1/P1 nuclease n=1 Tax=Novosphingobium rosa TaxID=76978 RepID=UPI0008369D14|nr:S1/P1 nuclease [Novosphingobium rosa]